MNGFYVGYIAGNAGQGLAMFSFKDGVLAGADLGGVLFDGTYTRTPDGFLGKVRVRIPGGVTTVQGFTAPDEGVSYEVPVTLPLNLNDVPHLQVVTPFGAVNFRLEKVRDL